MDRYSLQEAQAHLQQLINDAQNGHTVFIQDENEQAVQLVPVALTPKPRRAGSARGLIKMWDDFDAPIRDFGPYTE